jgi:hypothetical protein
MDWWILARKSLAMHFEDGGILVIRDCGSSPHLNHSSIFSLSCTWETSILKFKIHTQKYTERLDTGGSCL